MGSLQEGHVLATRPEVQRRLGSLVDIHLFLKPRMLEEIILVWKETSLLTELRCFPQSVILILESWSHLKCYLGQQWEDKERLDVSFSLYSAFFKQTLSAASLPLFMTIFLLPEKFYLWLSPDLKGSYKTSSLPHVAICMYFYPDTSQTGLLRSLSFL